MPSINPNSNKNRRKRKQLESRASLLAQQRRETPDPAHEPGGSSTQPVTSGKVPAQATEAEAPTNCPAAPSTTHPDPDAGESPQNVQSIHSSTAPSTTGASPNTGDSAQDAAPTQSPDASESPDTSETVPDTAPSPSPTTTGPATEIPTSSHEGDAYLPDFMGLLSTAQERGAHCRPEDCRNNVHQTALYTLQVVPFLGDCAQIVYRSLRVAQKELGYTPLDSSALYRELVDNEYEAWISTGGPDKPRPSPGRIRQMYECVNWINKKNDQIELSHKLVLLCLKEYTRRNSTFHSKLGNAGVEGNAENIEQVFQRDIARVTRLVGAYNAHRMKEVEDVMKVARRVKAHFFQYQRNYPEKGEKKGKEEGKPGQSRKGWSDSS